MNIFVLSTNPDKAAKYHCDKHVVKMTLESTQMLAAAAIANEAPEARLPKNKAGKPYRATHTRHPCTLWAGRSRDNYLWLHQLLVGLCSEYRERYGKIHSCESTLAASYRCAKYIPSGSLEPFAIAISQDSGCRQIAGFDKLSAVAKYRTYYLVDKAYFAKWRTKVPAWYKKGLKPSPRYITR